MQSLTYKVKPVLKTDFRPGIACGGCLLANPDAEFLRPTLKLWHDSARDFVRKRIGVIVGAYEGLTLAAVASIIDFPMHLGIRWVTCGGIAGVQHTRNTDDKDW